MAYLLPYAETCRWPLCTKRATQELRSWRNERMNYYCSKHAFMALKREKEREIKDGE